MQKTSESGNLFWELSQKFSVLKKYGNQMSQQESANKSTSCTGDTGWLNLFSVLVQDRGSIDGVGRQAMFSTSSC